MCNNVLHMRSRNIVCHAKDQGLSMVLRKLKLQFLQVCIPEIQYEYQKLVILSGKEVNLVEDDPVFARDGADVYVNSNISFTQAIFGCTVEVPTLSRKVQVKTYLEVLRKLLPN